ncbi:unnamed protein product [Rotaria sordida]|uniref:Uncharacterized protein n=1 Tax=Rotaria sordida TaxID=392033 RepID=A0A813WGN1_9BILA|nr:unnamed protein product [Rotaria sordida]CAF4024584.1 unnamed protein product [Rotaria sordida]
MASNYYNQFNREISQSSSVASWSNQNSSFNRIEHLFTNHFTCSFDKDTLLYQYDVVIEELGSRSNDWYEVKGRSRCSRIMQSFIHEHQLEPNAPVWYDEQKCLYSTAYISTPETKVSENGRNRLQIKSSTDPWPTNDINEYMNGKTDAYPHDAIRILDTLLKRSIQDRIKVINNKCYFFNEQSEDLMNGFEQRHGFIQALNLSSNRLTLNIQTKLTKFYSPQSLLDFIDKQIGERRIPSDYECKQLTRILKGCLVVTRQSNWKTSYEIVQFDRRRPGEIYTESGDSLIEYYEKKGFTLTQTDFPCIEVYSQNGSNSSCHLPLELCRIKEWQVYDEPIPELQMNDEGLPTPENRYNAIMDTLAKCDYNSSSNLLCRRLDFKIVTNEMLELDARILTLPEIQTNPSNRARIDNGRIYLNGNLFEPKSIKKLAIAYFGTDYQRNKGLVNKFHSILREMMRSFNINIQHVKLPETGIPNDMYSIDEYVHSMQQQQYTFVVCIMNANSQNDLTQLKRCIKTCGTILYGIMTQCAILSDMPRDDKKLGNYCENLIRKINFKNDGCNTRVNLDLALGNAKSKNDSFMFFGADVIHPTNTSRQHPSIAVVVGSGDSSCSRTAARICKQYPKHGKCSMETILGMAEMVEQLLNYNRQLNGVLPNKIVFYRDGIDDGQFRKIHDYEIPAIRQAFTNVYGDETRHPLLTLTIVKKRHNTRFFTYNPNPDQSSSNGNFRRTRRPPRETDNMSIGAVIDTTIVHRNHINFYLNSHNAFQGVNRPSHYHVLLNGIGLTTNQLQLLTFHLCFADPRSSAAEAIPSVVHQADIAALNARNLFYNDDNDASSTSTVDRRNPSSQNISHTDCTYEILQVHETLKNRPILS